MTLFFLFISKTQNYKFYIKQGCHFTWNLSKKKLEFEKLEKNLEFKTRIFKRPGIFNNFYIFSSKISVSNKNSILKIKFFVIIKNKKIVRKHI